MNNLPNIQSKSSEQNALLIVFNINIMLSMMIKTHIRQLPLNRLTLTFGLLLYSSFTYSTPLLGISMINVSIGYIVMLIIIAAVSVVLTKKLRTYKKQNKEMLHQLSETKKILETEREHNRERQKAQDQMTILFIQNFRTPLSSIIDPLKDITTKNTAVSNNHNMNAVYRNSLMMLDLCDQILGIYKERQRSNSEEKLKITSKNIDRLIDNVVSRYNELIRVNQISFHYNKYIRPDFELWINADTFKFILYSLMTNAFIHTHYEGVINLTISETIDDDNSNCMISISDNGKSGIQNLPQSTFAMAGADNISVVEFGYDTIENAVKVLHGAISIKSENNIGTQIVLTFPSSKAEYEEDENIIILPSETLTEEENTKQNEGEAENGGEKYDFGNEEEGEVSAAGTNTPVQAVEADANKKFRLLIIEERKDICLYLKVLLENTYTIITAPDGQKGVDIAIQDNPDLIICDIELPTKSGLECCKELKENLTTCHIPFIMITTKAEDEEIVHALKSGADDYMLKPFTPSILKAKINSLINNRSMLQKTYTRLLVQLEGENGEKAEEDAKNRFVKEIVRLVEENLNNENFSVKTLAADMNMSQPTLYRKVKQAANCSIIELITGVRIRKAGMLLKQKQYSVQEVAEMVGYNDVSTFRKRFVEIFGTTPSAFADEKSSQVV